MTIMPCPDAMRTLPLARCWAIHFERVRRFRRGLGTCLQPEAVALLTGYAERIFRLCAGHRFYAVGIFSDELANKMCAAVEPAPRSIVSRVLHRVGVGIGWRRRPVSVTSYYAVLYGAVEISDPGLLVRIWTDQWLESYGYVLSRVVLSPERLKLEIERLDEHHEYLVCRDDAKATDVARMLDDQDNSILYVHAVSDEFRNPETVLW